MPDDVFSLCEQNMNLKNILKEKCLTFRVIRLFTYLLKVRWEDWSHAHVYCNKIQENVPKSGAGAQNFFVIYKSWYLDFLMNIQSVTHFFTDIFLWVNHVRQFRLWKGFVNIYCNWGSEVKGYAQNRSIIHDNQIVIHGKRVCWCLLQPLIMNILYYVIEQCRASCAVAFNQAVKPLCPCGLGSHAHMNKE